MFTYLRVYDPGAILGTHRDQPSCRWNVDLVVGGEPRPERRNAWPLWLDGRRGPEPVRLGLGDGLLYRGDRLQHWRHAQPRRHTTVLASLHYGPPG
jgi:alkylated DNA repair dioxygenase AlkB